MLVVIVHIAVDDDWTRVVGYIIVDAAGGAFSQEGIVEVEFLALKHDILPESRVVAFDIDGAELVCQQILRLLEIVLDIVGLEELGEPAVVREDFKTTVIDFEVGNGVADVVDGDARTIMELEVVDALDVGVKAVIGGEKTPVGFLLVVERQLLEVL